MRQMYNIGNNDYNLVISGYLKQFPIGFLYNHDFFMFNEPPLLHGDTFSHRQ